MVCGIVSLIFALGTCVFAVCSSSRDAMTSALRDCAVVIAVRHSSLVTNMSVLAVFFVAVEVHHTTTSIAVDVLKRRLDHFCPCAETPQGQFVFYLASGTMVVKQAQTMVFICIFSALNVRCFRWLLLLPACRSCILHGMHRHSL